MHNLFYLSNMLCLPLVHVFNKSQVLGAQLSYRSLQHVLNAMHYRKYAILSVHRYRSKKRRKVEKKANVHDWSCLYCEESWSSSKHGEQWIRCSKCEEGAHILCTGYEKANEKFVCDFCWLLISMLNWDVEFKFYMNWLVFVAFHFGFDLGFNEKNP